MRFEVIWLPAAEAELAAIWSRTPNRAGVTAAAAELDDRLSKNGPEEGESRAGDLRIAFQRPLVILFRYEAAGRKIQVGSVWETR